MASDKLKRQAVIDLALGWKGPCVVRALPKARERKGIEALLTWAFRDELPKMLLHGHGPSGYKPGWKKTAEYSELLALIEGNDNCYGVVPDFSASSWPHPDAVTIHEAVCGLDELEIEGLAEFSPFEAREGIAPELLDRAARRVRDRVVTIDDAGRLRLREPLRKLVRTAAFSREPPEWRIKDFAQDVARWENDAVKYFRKVGHWEASLSGDVWVEYETAVSGVRPELDPSVAPKAVLAPDPVEDAVSRVHYELWRLALDVLAADLSGRLEKWDVVQSALPVRPWLEGEAPRGRVLRALSQGRFGGSCQRGGAGVEKRLQE